MTTYQQLIRLYSKDVARGSNDPVLTPRQRRLTEVMLNLASNSPAATGPYPPTSTERDNTVKHLNDLLWESRALVQAASPASDDDFSVAAELAVTILRNM